MLMGLKTPNPQIRIKGGGILGSNFGSGGKVKTYCSRPDVVPNPGPRDLANGGGGAKMHPPSLAELLQSGITS